MKNTTMTFRISKEEKLKLQEIAKIENLTLTKFIKRNLNIPFKKLKTTKTQNRRDIKLNKSKLTMEEISLLQYFCECVYTKSEIEVNLYILKKAERLAKIMSNFLMSEDNQIIIDEPEDKSISLQKYFIERE